MKIVIVMLIISQLSACATINEGERLPLWALVDISEIQRKIEAIAEAQNPVPTGYQYDPSKLNQDISKASSALESRLRYERIMCLKDEKIKEDALRNFHSGIPDRRILGGNPIPIYDSECFNGIEVKSSIKQAKEEHERLLEIQKYLNVHKRNINEKTNERAQNLVAEYAAGRFILVADKRTNAIYNKSGTTLDITGVILKQIESPTFLIVVDFPESAR